MTTKFTVRLKKSEHSIKYFDTFEEAVKYARTFKQDHPYVEVRFVCFEDDSIDNCKLVDGFMSKTLWTAQDDVEA